MNAPALEVLALQLAQIQRQLNAITGHIAAHGSMETISPTLQGAASLALLHAERAVTQAFGAVDAAVTWKAPKPLNPDSIEAAQEAMSRG